MKLFQRQSLSALMIGISLAIGSVIGPAMNAALAQETPSSSAVPREGRQLGTATPITVVLDQKVASGQSQQDELIKYHVANDVLSQDGKAVLIKANTPAVGKVMYSSGSGWFGRSGKLKISCDYIQLPDGTRLPTSPTKEMDKHGPSNKGASIALTLVVSVLGFLWKGGNVWVNPGAQFQVYSRESALIRPAVDLAAVPPPTPAIVNHQPNPIDNGSSSGSGAKLPAHPIRIPDLSSEPRIALIDGNSVTLTVGTAGGFDTGAIVAAWIPVPITDPATGQLIDTQQIRVNLKVFSSGQTARCWPLSKADATRIPRLTVGMPVKLVIPAPSNRAGK
jgi:hypothetical protein